jgi:hypothetical protein
MCLSANKLCVGFLTALPKERAKARRNNGRLKAKAHFVSAQKLGTGLGSFLESNRWSEDSASDNVRTLPRGWFLTSRALVF